MTLEQLWIQIQSLNAFQVVDFLNFLLFSKNELH